MSPEEAEAIAAIEGRKVRTTPPPVLDANATAWEVFQLALSGLRRGAFGEPLGLDLAAVVELIKAYHGDVERDTAKVVALYTLWEEKVARPELEEVSRRAQKT